MLFNDYLPGFLPFPTLQLGQQKIFSSPTLSEVTMTKMLGHEYQRFFLLLLNDLLKIVGSVYELPTKNIANPIHSVWVGYIKTTANPHFSKHP